MADVYLISAYAVVELAFGYIQFGRLLPQREDQRPQFDLRNRQDAVGEVERTHTYHQHCQHKRTYNTEQGYTCRFHGSQFNFLTQVAERYQRSQQHSQRQCQRHNGRHGIDKELRQHAQLNALAHEVAHMHPYELHEQYEDTHHKRQQEQTEEVPQYIHIQPLDG